MGSSGGITTPSVIVTSANVAANGEVKAEDVKNEAKSAVEAALKAALAAGKPSTGITAEVSVKNAESITAAALADMAKAAKAAGGSVLLKADTVDASGAVTARLYIDPAAAAKLKGDIKLGVKTDAASTQATEQHFSKFFDNKTAVLSFAQQGSFDVPVKVAVKADLTELDTKSLKFYSYDKKTNIYTELPKTAYTIDTNGYLHFTTTVGGEIIITDKPLVKKK
ncbi:MAG: hypothetical protein RSC64_05945 [Hydrogenoanaerobacterium sp.]